MERGGPAAGGVDRSQRRSGSVHARERWDRGRPGGRQRRRGAPQGDNFGFILLRRAGVVRRIPYAFSVTRPQLTGSPTTPLRPVQTGDTRSGDDRARAYRWPTLAFGVLSLFGVDPSVNDDGREKVYTLDIARQAVNAGVVIDRPQLKLDAPITSILSSNAPIHPWFLSSLDENDVQGYSGIPVNSNGLMPDFLYNVGAAGGVFLPPPGATTSPWTPGATSSQDARSHAHTGSGPGVTSGLPTSR